jgi:hypothetical protein
MRSKPKTHRLPLLLAIGLAAVGSGCAGHHDGTLQQNWTIAGTTNSNLCDVHGATQARVVVFTTGLFITATQFAPCNAFSTTLSLHEDTYTSSLTFVDANGVPVSDTRAIAPFIINGDQTTTLNADFAVTDFLVH